MLTSAGHEAPVGRLVLVSLADGAQHIFGVANDHERVEAMVRARVAELVRRRERRVLWKKLHLGVDGSGTIVAHTLTDGNTDDASTGLVLIETVDAAISCVTADGAYDTVAIYEAADVRGAKVVVPPTVTPAVSRRRPRSSLRDRAIRKVKHIGPRQWKKESGYHRQARVENAFFRYKSIIGDRLRARHPRAQETETAIACTILNRMTELGRPVSFAIGP